MCNFWRATGDEPAERVALCSPGWSVSLGEHATLGQVSMRAEPAKRAALGLARAARFAGSIRGGRDPRVSRSLSLALHPGLHTVTRFAGCSSVSQMAASPLTDNSCTSRQCPLWPLWRKNLLTHASAIAIRDGRDA